MTRSLDVLCYGNAIVDLLAKADDAFLKSHDLTKGMMHLTDQDKSERIYNTMGPAVEVSGGSAANTAAGLASFGADAGFIGKVRDDLLGKFFTHDIRAAGVTFDTAPANDGPSTATSMILVTPDGERTMNTFLGACQKLTVKDVDEPLTKAARIVYLEGYLWDPVEAIAAFQHAAEIAKASGGKVALTLSDVFVVNTHRAEFLQQLKASALDIVFANEAEVLALYQLDDFDKAAAQLAKDVPLAVITRSEKGCVIYDRGAPTHVAAANVAKVVDTTGAGDLFAAGFLFGLSKDMPLHRCGELGALAAAEIISHIGARPQTSLKLLATQKGLLPAKAA